MKKNKIAGLVVASALLVGASSAAHTHPVVKNNNKNNNDNSKTSNEVLLAAPSKQVSKNAMVVNGNNELVLRSSASSDSQVVSNISVGEMLSIQSYSSNWYKVTVKETGSTGYISSSNLRFIESGVNSATVDLNNNGSVVNVSSALNLRTEPTMASSVMSTLENGTNFRIVAKKGEWYQISVNGSTGFVYGGYVNVGSEIKAPVKKSTPKVVEKTTTKVADTHVSQKVTQNVAKTTTTHKQETTKKSDNLDVAKAPIKPVQTSKSAKTLDVKSPTTTLAKSLNNDKAESTPSSFIAVPSSMAVKQNTNSDNNTTQKHEKNINALNNNSKDSVTVTKESHNSSNSKSNSTEMKSSKVTNTNLDNAKTQNVKHNNENQAVQQSTSKNTSKVENNNNTENSNVATKTVKHDTISNKTTNHVAPTQNKESQKETTPKAKVENTNNETSTTTVKKAIKPEVQTGSLTLTIYQTNTELPLANTSITVNGNSYTTNAAGKVKISDLNAGNHKFNLSSNGFNSTYGNINIKAGKNMNSIMYITKTVTHNTEVPAPAPKVETHNENAPAKPAVEHKSAPKVQESHNSESNAQLGQAIVNYAEQYIGRPYVWGATGPNSFDCSGLTYYVYKHFGYYIGCTTYTQIDKGTPVSKNDLQAGDLIFWGDPSAPYHVAIYIGGGQYIQAPHTGATVDISSWNLDNISAARRII